MNQKNDLIQTKEQIQSESTTKDWPHAPIHRMGTDGVFMVTGATLYKEHFFVGPDRLDLLEENLLTLAKEYRWQLEAWAVFANHYHFIGRGARSEKLGDFLNHLHSDTARKLNQFDSRSGREVWYNFWDTKLTYERSYLARLNYVHQNPVKHGLVYVANQYPWCSAAWFERTASPAEEKRSIVLRRTNLRSMTTTDLPGCGNSLECDGPASLCYSFKLAC